MENYVSIDIGSKYIKILLAEKKSENKKFKIKSKLSGLSSGIDFGNITNPELFANSLRKNIMEFEKENNIKIENAIINLDGYGTKSHSITVEQKILEDEISEFDITEGERKAIADFKKKSSDDLVETIIKKYTLDEDFDFFSNPLGLKAKKLKTEFLFITIPKNNLELLEKSFDDIDIDCHLSLLSSVEVSVTKLDRELGCALVDIGNEKISVAIFEKNKLNYYDVFKNGSKNITKKLSSKLKIDFDKAEEIKQKKFFDKKVEKIINLELENIGKEVFEKIKKDNKNHILPGGIILVGGGSKIKGVEKIFSDITSLPTKKPEKTIHDQNTDFHVACGNIHIQTKKGGPKIRLPAFLKTSIEFCKNSLKKMKV